jgi:hypothetical protein
MFDFVHRENIRRFEKALATCRDRQKQATLLNLIAEEKAKLEEALRLTEPPQDEENPADTLRK